MSVRKTLHQVAERMREQEMDRVAREAEEWQEYHWQREARAVEAGRLEARRDYRKPSGPTWVFREGCKVTNLPAPVDDYVQGLWTGAILVSGLALFVFWVIR